MDAVSKQTERLRFGEFTLDTRRRGLYQGEERVRLTAKPLEALIVLVEHHGRTVEKQALLDAVWKDTFVTEDVLIHAIREIRRALGDDKDNPRFVQTVPRQGYRFVGEVTADIASPLLPSSEQDAAPPLTLAVDKRHVVPRWIWLTLAALTLIAITVWGFGSNFHLAGKGPSPFNLPT